MSTKGISQERYGHFEEIQIQLRDILGELYDASRLEQGDILVIGCSTSEVAGGRIGTYSSQEIGECLFRTAHLFCRERGIYLACQCCEHLNRSLIIEKACMKEHRLARVNAVPQLKAGGALATAASRHMQEPVAVEGIVAQAGVDIGDTLIGMHLAPVAVPVRTRQRRIGQAHVVCARTRAKYVGGSRAAYDDFL